jgi:type I restriction enzyme M protein
MAMFLKYEGYKNGGGEWSGMATSPKSLKEVTAEILQLEQETEGLLKRLVSFGSNGGGDD